MLGGVSTEMLGHFLKTLAVEAGICLHIDVLRGENDHHKIESAFKAFALALRDALTVVSSDRSVPSTKGAL